MIKLRKKATFQIYEAGSQIRGNQTNNEYFVICRKDGESELWGQINEMQSSDDLMIVIRHNEKEIIYNGLRTDMKRGVSVANMVLNYTGKNSESVGELAILKNENGKQIIRITDNEDSKVFVQQLDDVDSLELVFSDDGEFLDNSTPWYFRRFEDSVMAAKVEDEGDKGSNTYKEKYGVTLPADISDEMTAIIMTIPLVSSWNEFSAGLL